MQKYIYFIILTTITILLGYVYLLQKDNIEKDIAIHSLVEGYEIALSIKEEETISKIKKAEIESNSRLKIAIEKRGNIETIRSNNISNNDDFISFGF